MQFPARLFVFVVSACAAINFASADTTPLDIAKSTLESFRKDADRKLTTFTFPENAVPIPTSAEIYLIQGYICYNCIRITWSDGKATAQRVKMTRTWFYSAKEGYTCEQFDIPAADFKKAWEAALLVRSAVMSVNTPKPRSPFRGGYSSSSHEWTYFVRISTDNDKRLLEWSVRGIKTNSDIQSFDDIQTRAISKIFSDLIPKDAPSTPFDLKSWGPFLTGILAQVELVTKANPERLDPKDELLIETTLRLLGQSGYAPALDVINGLQVDAKQPALKSDGLDWQSRVARETIYAKQKIEFQENFDPEQATIIIHNFGRSILPDRDFVLWLREEFFKQKPAEYFALLSSDIQNRQSSEDILKETISDLKTRYPEKAASLLKVVLNNSSSEVVSDAALALLEQDKNNEDALKALNRLVSDPAASIPSGARSFDYFGRERALDYLASERAPVPQQYRWDIARIETQLKQPWDDGRMINRLISKWSGLLNRSMPDDQQIAAYRRTLAGEINRGTVEACEALIKLNDKDSGSRIAEVLREMEANCNKELAWKPDPTAKYPWIDKYEIERVRADLKKMIVIIE